MKFILKRIITAVFTMFLVSILSFLFFSVIRGDPASLLSGTDAPAEQIEALREEMGLNRNVFIRYFDWLFNFLRGNSGDSLRFREPVSRMILTRLPVSAALALLSLALVLFISVPVSLLTARREGGIADRITNVITAAFISAPGFFLGLLFIFIFGLSLKLFVPGEYIDYNENFFGFIGCLFFPALAIAFPSSAVLIKFLRGSLFQEINSDYVRTAKSKGAGGIYIMRRHVLKNASLPAVTALGMIAADVFSGSIIIEQVFSIPGTGRLLIAAISSRDYPLIQALMVYIAFITVLAHTLADIAIIALDPRIKQ